MTFDGLVLVVTQELFCQIPRIAFGDFSARLLQLLDQARHSQVAQFKCAAGALQNVFRLDIQVNNVFVVQPFKAEAAVPHHPKHVFFSQPSKTPLSPLLGELAQRLTTKLHNNVQEIFFLPA